MRTGLYLVTFVPSPSLPSVFNPHAHKEPSVFRATVCQSPAATDYQSVPVPMRAGASLLTVDPSPKLP